MLCIQNTVTIGVVDVRKKYNITSVALTETSRYLELCSTCLKEGLGHSKPATNSRTSTLTHCMGFLLYLSLTKPSPME